MDATLTEKAEHWLAVKLIERGFAESRVKWNALCALSPKLAGMVAVLNEYNQYDNRKIWWIEDVEDDGEEYDASDIAQHAAEMADALIEKMERKSTPLGLDNFRVVAIRLSLLPEDKGRMEDADYVHESLGRREILSERMVSGNRWHDLKRGNGDGKQRLLDLLIQNAPMPNAPVTVLIAVVLGHGFARLQKSLAAQA